MGIKAFIFDCGGVLLRNSDPGAYNRWEDRLGLQRGELARRLWAGEAYSLAECGRLTDEQFWLRAGEQLGLRDSAQVGALRQDLWDTWALDDRVLALIDSLRRSHRIALLSNATDALEEMLAERYRVADRFEVIINSAHVGIAKPERGIYEEALRVLKVKSDEVVFIDDRAENVAAAAALGMHVVWFVHAGELQRQLEAHLHR